MKLKFFLLLIWLSCFFPLVWGQDSNGNQTNADSIYNSNPIIAVIDGEEVRIDDVMNKKINDLLGELYGTLEQELAEYALEKLAKTNQDFKTVPVEISDKEIEEFYQKNQLQKRGSLEEYRSQIKQYMTDQRIAIQRAHQYAKAAQAGMIKNYLAPPSEFLVTAYIGTGMIRTEAKNARVMFLEYSDFQCPYCSKAQGTITNLMKKYKGQVAFSYRHFPLSFHKEADDAANAVECAREQGKFEEMHKILYANQRKQFPDDLKAYGKQIKIKDLKKFNQCIDQDKYRELVQNDIREGTEIGISGTPGFVIGTYDAKNKKVTGEVLSGARPQANFEQLIQKYLNKKS
ncbi:MAG: thioredoxin domain-containing protein [SAR324 cluster bacterium]|nr:thioredoxin domain-containing protein [SAR324 cluster bacterium]